MTTAQSTAMSPASPAAGDVVFPAYSALDRVPAYAGVPLLPGVIVFAVSLLIGLLGGVVLGPVGLVSIVIGVPVLLWLRVVCETDDQALRIVWLEILCAVDRRNAAAFGGTYTLCPVRYGRSRLSIHDQIRRSFEPCWTGSDR